MPSKDQVFTRLMINDEFEKKFFVLIVEVALIDVGSVDNDRLKSFFHSRKVLCFGFISKNHVGS